MVNFFGNSSETHVKLDTKAIALTKGKSSFQGWIVLKTDDPKAIYQHAAEWGEFLNWETTPVFTDEEAGPIVAKVYS